MKVIRHPTQLDALVRVVTICISAQWFSACNNLGPSKHDDSSGEDSNTSDEQASDSGKSSSTSSTSSFTFEVETTDVFPTDWTMTTHECADSTSTVSDPIVPGMDASGELSAICKLAEGIGTVYQRGANSNSDGLPEILRDQPSGWFACTNRNPSLPIHVRPHFVRIDALDCVSDHGQPGCMRDSDCTPQEMCVCAGDVPRGESAVIDAMFDANGGGESYQFNGLANSCLRSGCQDGCGGFGCAVSVDNCFKQVGAFCHTSRDECRIHDDCATDVPGYCSYDEECGYWRCIDYWICD